MPRRRKLDPYVSSFIDRHGRERFRFRRDRVSIYLPPPGTKEYREAYTQALTGVAGLSRAKPGTVADLVARFYQSIPFRRAGEGWQATMRRVIEPFREQYGPADIAEFKTRDINTIIARKMLQTVEEGRKHGGTAAAERLREALIRLFEVAIAEEMIDRNPAKSSDKVGHKVKGYYPWTELDIAQYRERWPLGTKARLALELILWTGARRGNAHKMAPPVDGRLKAVAVKTGKEIDVPVKPALQAAIDAMPDGDIGTETLLITKHGKPYSAAGFGNKMREWCDAAKLPKCSAHGLRKALARRGADLGASQQALKAVGQWSNDAEVRTYVESANRKALAESVLDEVAEWERTENIG